MSKSTRSGPRQTRWLQRQQQLAQQLLHLRQTQRSEQGEPFRQQLSEKIELLDQELALLGLSAELEDPNRPVDVDRFFDVLSGATSGVRIACSPVDDQTLQFSRNDQLLWDVQTRAARAKLRMLCARLAVIGSEKTGREISPHGDEFEFVQNGALRFHVQFSNRPDAAGFSIESNVTR